MILSICEIPEVLKVLRIVNIVITIIKIAVPIILMISLMIDLTKATLSNDNDALVKTGRLTVNKAIALVLVFMIPTFVKVITTVVIPGFSYSACLNNATEEGIKASYENVMNNYMNQAKTKGDSASYNLANNYLKNIENPELKKKYEEELKVVYDKIEAEKKKKEEDLKNRQNVNSSPTNSSTSRQVDPRASYQPGMLKGDTFLQTARNVWERIVLGNQHFVYHQGNSVPVKNNLCDCSTYVSWVIYEYGYSDWAGHQRTTYNLYNTNYQKKYGWEEHYYSGRTNLTSLVQPGDIIVRRNSAGGHTDIIASVSGGNIRAYDCGSSTWVKNGKYPNGIPTPSFLKDTGKYRPAKIIRVKPKN